MTPLEQLSLVIVDGFADLDTSSDKWCKHITCSRCICKSAKLNNICGARNKHFTVEMLVEGFIKASEYVENLGEKE